MKQSLYKLESEELLCRQVEGIFPASLHRVSLVLLAGFLSASASQGQEIPADEWRKPPALKPGDTVMFIAPAAPVELPSIVEYARRLEKAGYKTRIPKGIDRKMGYLAGSDEERAAELNAAIRDPKVRAIFPCRGGYGLTRILDRIDYTALRSDPKILIGFSDLTALHLAVARQARVITFHSPLATRVLWQENKKDAFAASSFQRAIFAERYVKGETGYMIEVPEELPRPVKLVGGKARGRLLGGNLTLICSTLGTPYAIQPKGAILFIEDVNEAPYRIDRHLSQLRLAGVLDAVAGIIVGSFLSRDPKDEKEFDRLFREYFGSMKVPVVLRFPIGHTAHNATLPHGALAELDADKAVLRLLENPVSLEPPSHPRTGRSAAAAGRLQTIGIAHTCVAVDGGKSSEALKALREALAAHPSSLSALASKDFASVPLTKANAALARKLIWQFHVAIVRKERSYEVTNRLLKDEKLEMPFFFKVFGERPREGHSLWISLHGGGGTPKRVNDRQWENQKNLYSLSEGIYLAPRAPTDTWNLWHQDHIDRLFARLVEDMIALEHVNPDRVYVLGYSAGGDGVYQLAPRLADRWAAAAMMAGHPNGVSLLSLRNVPFALQVGANDSAYNRNKVAKEYGDQLARLRKDDPGGYEHFVKIYPGKGHWMDREDKAALPWMAGFTRNPVPTRVVWKQTAVPHPCSYWLAVPPGEAKSDALVIASRGEQTISIAASDKVSKLLVHLDDRMMDLDREVRVMRGGKELFAGVPSRTVAVMLRTLAGRGDPRLMFDAEIALDLTENR